MAELFISEYIEGSNNNKAIELYNPTGIAIDLEAGNYQLEIYFNGNTIPNTTIDITGTIAPDDVFVLADIDAALGVTPDQTDGSNFFNGDDAIVLKKDGIIIDSIGQIGVDPGAEWGNGLISTQNNTLRRKSNIVTGDTDPTDAFDPSLEWEGFAENIFDGLNAHTGADITKISAIQGFGASSPLAGRTVLIEAIATADFQGNNGLAGFFVQEEDADIDTSLQTSEGIFIADGNSPAVDINVGDLVRITGTISEVDELTQLTNPNVTIISSGNALPTATTIDNLAAAKMEGLENFEGMQVNLTENLTVSEYYQLGRFGHITLSSNGRETQFTHNNAPSIDAYFEHRTIFDYSRIILDDGSETTSPNPIIFGRGGNPLSATNLLRGGDTVNGISGILDYRFGDYRVQRNSGVNFNPVNDRPATPPDVGGNLKVASFNLQNYFTTIDDGINGARGADSAAELTLQTDKLLSAISAIDADIFGLIELENNGYSADSAIPQLVNSLNAELGAGTYDFVNPGLSALGSDDIAVGFIYKPDQVDLIGTAATKSDGAFANFNRQPLAQTFAEKATGEKFTVAVNHFKSKGSLTGLPEDNDQLDGQGNNNFTRTQAAEDLSNWLATDPTNSNDPDFLIIGDLNAYAQEDPITTLKNAGYTNLIDQFNGSDAYSFIFNGQLGYLDHALGNESLTSQVTGVEEWHINADEPNVFDYNETNIASLYQANPFRSSDHDPLIVGLNLNVAPVLDNNGSPTLTTINEDEVNPTGTLVADLISGIFNDSNPNNRSGIAVNGVNHSDGDWEYSLDGISWNSFGNPSQTNARLLDRTAQVRFLPETNFNGTVTSGITFRAWDGTSGSNGEMIDASNFGGNSAFSVESETAQITVNPVNDAPSFLPGANQTVNQDAGTQVVNWATDISAGGGVDEAAQNLTFNVSNDSPSLFAAQPTIDGNGTLSFTPAANSEGTATVFVSLTDDGGTANGGVDTSAVRSFTIAVNPVAADVAADVTVDEPADDPADEVLSQRFSLSPADDPADEVRSQRFSVSPGDDPADEVRSQRFSLSPANGAANEVDSFSPPTPNTTNSTPQETDLQLFPRPPLDPDFTSPPRPLPTNWNLEILLSDYIGTSSLGDGILNSPYLMDRIVNGEDNLDDNITGEELNESIAPLGGHDFIRAMEGFDYIEGGEGNDTLNGNQEHDLVNGGLGDDSLHGGKNNDTVNGGMGDDIVRGDFGDDILDGWQDDDFLNGNQGNDWIDGGEGDDVLHGGKNEDTLIGGNGDDWLFGDLGNDSLIGGSGEDVFVLEIGRGSDAIADFTDNTDKIGLAGGLTVDRLTILSSNNHTLIQVDAELLATLYNIDANQITSEDFLLLG